MGGRKKINGQMLTLAEAYEQNFGLISEIAFKYLTYGKRLGFDHEDLISAGKIGFVKAFQKYDATTENKFSTYAYPVISGYVQMEVNRKNVNERITSGVKDMANEVIKMELEHVDIKTIMKLFKVDYSYAYEVFHYIFMRSSHHLEKRYKDESGEPRVRLIDVIGKETDLTRIFVNDYKQLLTDLEIEVYDLLAKGYTQTDIQDILGLKRTTISMRVMKMKKKLAHLIPTSA